jgi:hypothetical protein
MFCDLIGSTAISAKLDAEEWRDLVGSYLDAASAAVMEMGGHAHENDPERAARAALSISARARRTQSQERRQRHGNIAARLQALGRAQRGRRHGAVRRGFFWPKSRARIPSRAWPPPLIETTHERWAEGQANAACG